MTDASVGTWLYAVCGSFDPGRLTGLAGVGGESTRVLEHEGLAAVVISVNLDEFGEEPLRRHLENDDLAWLEEVAVRHHEVVSTVAGISATLPMRLATVYREETRIGMLLGERGEGFREALRRVSGRTEWAVKAFVVPAAGAPEAPDTPDAGPGTAYLIGRRARRSAAEDRWRGATELAQKVDNTLRWRSVAAREHSTRVSGLSPDATMLLNVSYLVEDAQAEEFQRAVDRLTDRHPELQLTLTGPWPAYSFTGQESS